MVVLILSYNIIFIVIGLFLTKKCCSFLITSDSSRKQQLFFNAPNNVHQASFRSTALRSDKFNRDINEKSRKRASSEGGGSIATGAILGGLVCGPFGALFGATVGGNIGTKNAFDRARKEEMENKGITQEMLDAAEEVGCALEQSMLGMKATTESLRSQQSLARRLEEDMNDSYEKAKEAIVDEREEEARSLLLTRKKNEESLKDSLKRCSDEMKRIKTMESNVSALQKRALEVEAILQRAVGAKARQNSSDFAAREFTSADSTDFSLSQEDPLLKKFRDLEME